MTEHLDTIVAPATVTGGTGALAIVRLDGPRAFLILEELSGKTLEDRLATRVDLTHDQERIDEAVAVGYRAPRSFTGNDLVEVTTHGSRWVVGRLIEASVALGARLAGPGEFSERAVLNGKIDLTQAEAVGDLIASRTARQAELALANLDGQLGDRVRSLRARLLDVRSRLEASLDFSEDGYEFIESAETRNALEMARSELGVLAGSFRRGRATREGIRVAILGRPNVGKSTLLNALLGYDRAIVTEVPGTTRDVIRESIDLGGYRVILTDTAGIRETEDGVERIGVELSRAEGAGAELVLYAIAADEQAAVEDREILDGLESPLIVWTKGDLRGQGSGSGDRGADSGDRFEDGLVVSGLTGDGVADLLDVLSSRVEEIVSSEGEGATLVNERQLELVEAAKESVSRALEAVNRDAGEEIVAADLKSASDQLGAIIGAISDEEMMASIFSSFCIGK